MVYFCVVQFRALAKRIHKSMQVNASLQNQTLRTLLAIRDQTDSQISKS